MVLKIPAMRKANRKNTNNGGINCRIVAGLPVSCSQWFKKSILEKHFRAILQMSVHIRDLHIRYKEIIPLFFFRRALNSSSGYGEVFIE